MLFNDLKCLQVNVLRKKGTVLPHTLVDYIWNKLDYSILQRIVDFGDFFVFLREIKLILVDLQGIPNDFFHTLYLIRVLSPLTYLFNVFFFK